MVGTEGEEGFKSSSPCLECVLSARYCVRALYGVTTQSPQELYEIGTITVPILRMQKGN